MSAFLLWAHAHIKRGIWEQVQNHSMVSSGNVLGVLTGKIGEGRGPCLEILVSSVVVDRGLRSWGWRVLFSWGIFLRDSSGSPGILASYRQQVVRQAASMAPENFWCTVLQQNLFCMHSCHWDTTCYEAFTRGSTDGITWYWAGSLQNCGLDTLFFNTNQFSFSVLLYQPTESGQDYTKPIPLGK